MQARVLEALETAGVFTSGGLVKDKVLSIKAFSDKLCFSQCEDFLQIYFDINFL